MLGESIKGEVDTNVAAVANIAAVAIREVVANGVDLNSPNATFGVENVFSTALCVADANTPRIGLGVALV